MKKRDSDAGRERTPRPLLHSTYSRRRVVLVSLISMLIMVGTVLPSFASAGVVGDFFSSLALKVRGLDIRPGTAQTIPLAQAAKNIDPSPAIGGGDITIVDNSALMPEEGPSGTIADIEKPKNQTISLYVVRDEDTLSSIAQLFGVSANTILWANDLKRGAPLKVGQTLTILPVTGIKYTIKKGDTLASVAKRFSGDQEEIANFNGVSDGALAIGDEIIIPDGEIAAVPVAQARKISSGGRSSISEPAHNVGPRGSNSEIAYYTSPLASYIETQGIHGYNAVDMAAPSGTPIMAAATGDVIVARGSGGYNGGYGNYAVIQHNNGSQTLYGHASKLIVSAGDHVVRGQIIGYVGTTGKSTGPHLHFEIRGGIRNPF